MSPDRPGDDDPFADDPFEDPFAGDPLEDPFADDPFGGSDESDSDEDLEEAFDDISRSTLLAFIVVGVLVHVGLIAAALGLLLVGFRGQWLVGVGLTLAGFVAFGLAVASYRRYRDDDTGGEKTSAASEYRE